MNISEHIFLLLDKQGKKAKELADFLGVSQSSVSAWKNEGSFPSSKFILRITEFFGVSLEMLFTGESAKEATALLQAETEKNLPKAEQELLYNYRKLDSRGQHKLQAFIYDELDRVKSDHDLREAITKGTQYTFDLPFVEGHKNPIKK